MISMILDGVKTLVGWFKESAKAKHEKNMAVIDLEKRLLLSKQEANSQWELHQLKDKDKLIRFLAFMLFASPLIANLISPEWGTWVQRGWHSLTPLQAEMLRGICGAVFGYKPVANMVGAITGSITDAIRTKKKL